MKEEEPRERLERLGPEALTAAELIAVVLGSGVKGKSVFSLARELIRMFGGLTALAGATLEELCQVKGVGRTKALQLQATFSLGDRVSRSEKEVKKKITHPLHVYQLVREELVCEKREQVLVLLSDIRGHLISIEVVSIGTLSNVLLHPRDVFYPAIRHRAAQFALVHNHPSGDPTPSREDIQVTTELLKVAHLLGIPMWDHLIVGDDRYTSLRQSLAHLDWS